MLSENWITEKTTDFEYKKYIALAYLQSVYNAYKEQKLEPHLSEIIKQHETLINLINQKNFLEENQPKQIVGIDWKNIEIKYKPNSPFSLEDIERIIDFVRPKFKKAKSDGYELKQEILSKLSVETIGIIPVYQNEGYLMLEIPPACKTTVYRYSNYSFSQDSSYQYQYVGDYLLSVSQTYFQIKSELTNEFDLPVPATYLVSSKNYYPVKDTFLPLAIELFENFHSIETNKKAL